MWKKYKTECAEYAAEKDIRKMTHSNWLLRQLAVQQ